MSTLVAIVRELAAASTAEASDPRIIEALNTHSVRVDSQALAWNERLPDGSTRRTTQAAIGKYRVEASAATGSVTPPVLHDAAGATIGVLTIDQAGVVTASGSAALPTAYLTGRVFDVYAAAAEIVEVRIAAAAAGFDFKRGDQTFERSQIMPALERLRRQLAAKRVPRVRGEITMSDQQAAPC